MSTKKSIEELYELRQEDKITWLEFVRESEYAQEYETWCNEYGFSATDDTAFLFLEKKDFDCLASADFDSTEPIQFVLS